MWSFGVLMWEIFTLGKKPYLVHADKLPLLLDKLKNGTRLPPPNNCPENFYSVMMSCWLFDAHSRPDFVKLEMTVYNLRKHLGS